MLEKPAFWTWLLACQVLAHAVVLGMNLSRLKGYDLTSFAEATILGLVGGVWVYSKDTENAQKFHDELMEAFRFAGKMRK